MITPEWCQHMARYNAWQNGWMGDAVEALDEDALRADRGAFFGSILGTLNHLLWADTIWLARFDGGEGVTTGIPESAGFCADVAEWRAKRRAMDARISRWASGVTQDDLLGDLTWFSGAMGREITHPKAICVMQVFNHQTHHRGQVHAMLTAAGVKTDDTDIPFMPELA